MEFKVIRKESDFVKFKISRTRFIDFLYRHLDRFRDSKKAIGLCIDYAFSKSRGKGGFLILCLLDGKIAGELVMIKTGMSKYIPENFLVYIAVDKKYRGQGIGTKIIDKAVELTKGNIALHVEYDNPAKRLYERIGFTSKYAEMRYNK